MLYEFDSHRLRSTSRQRSEQNGRELPWAGLPQIGHGLPEPCFDPTLATGLVDIPTPREPRIHLAVQAFRDKSHPHGDSIQGQPGFRRPPWHRRFVVPAPQPRKNIELFAYAHQAAAICR
jgi:hypothetical protein